MLYRVFLVVSLLHLACAVEVRAQQRMQEREQEFLKASPLVNEPIPDVTIFHADGSPFRTTDLRGHYTVLTFGCLTCPPSMWNIPGIEAVHRDYSPKGVQFYYTYKALAHPEINGAIIQPFTQEERLAQARQAEEQFGTKIPWLVDAMDNRLKHALGDRPNAQFLIGPDGIIVSKRAWANPGEVRRELEKLVGPADTLTREDDLQLAIKSPIESAAPRGVVQQIPRTDLLPIVVQPKVEADSAPFFAKLRAEVEPSVLKGGAGRVYLGFHLDPLHRAHWNNLTKPLRFEIEVPESVRFDQLLGTAANVSSPSDADPREFLLTAESWPAAEPIQLTVVYFACVGEESCHAVRQQYTLLCQRDADGGNARSEGAGFWDPDDFARQVMRGDSNRDGLLERSEVVGLVLPHFEKLDTNQDGFLDLTEVRPVGEWLNRQHQPGTPAAAANRATK